MKTEDSVFALKGALSDAEAQRERSPLVPAAQAIWSGGRHTRWPRIPGSPMRTATQPPTSLKVSTALRRTRAKREAAKRWKEGDAWSICDYTNRKPLNQSDVTVHNDEPRTEAEREAARDNVLARIRAHIKRTL